ncbi:MAG: GrpB family protein [Armatimonas sp.]
MPYIVVPYNPDWPGEFARLGGNLRHVLGELALRIDHIGSTSVPNLAAKDIIDIQITVDSLSEELDSALKSAGYQRFKDIVQDHVPPGASADISEWSKWVFKPPIGKRAANIHVRLMGKANQRYPLLCRDYLRAHPHVATAYAQAKLALIAHGMDSPEAYYDVKDPIFDIIMGGAEAWATTTQWRPGPSDS